MRGPLSFGRGRRIRTLNKVLETHVLPLHHAPRHGTRILYLGQHPLSSWEFTLFQKRIWKTLLAMV